MRIALAGCTSSTLAERRVVRENSARGGLIGGRGGRSQEWNSEGATAAVAETAGTITIAAYGSTPGTAPCTAQAVTLVGYITTRSPIAARRIVHTA
jgi:hypothetical protein